MCVVDAKNLLISENFSCGAFKSEDLTSFEAREDKFMIKIVES